MNLLLEYYLITEKIAFAGKEFNGFRSKELLKYLASSESSRFPKIWFLPSLGLIVIID